MGGAIPYRCRVLSLDEVRCLFQRQYSDAVHSKNMLANSNKRETHDEYVARLRRTALCTSASIIDNCLGKIKANIDETVASGGKNTKSLLK